MAHIYIPICSIVCLLVCSAVSAADQPNLNQEHSIVPEQIAGVTTLSAEGVVRHIMAEQDIIIVDARIKRDRTHGHIEGSLSLPDIDTNCDSLQTLNADKDRHMLFYCNGIKCGRSAVSIKIARSCGYSKLSWFRGGFEEWKQKGYQYVKQAY